MKTDKSELITVIEKTIDVLVNNKVEYNWYDFKNCNCGILAQQACGISSQSLYEFSNGHGTWVNAVKRCPKTGTPLSHVINKLYSIGLTTQDIIELEDLSNLRILGKANIDPDYIHSLSPSSGSKPGSQTGDEYKYNLIKYLKAWRELLIEESQPEVKTEYRLVYSDKKVKDLTKEELIMN